jgi:hypothetical protein
MKHLVFLLLITLAMKASAIDGQDGNGGDHVRATFIQVGHDVLRYLRLTEPGRQLVLKHRLSTPDLQATLDINRIKVSTTHLIDNGKSKVDAIGTKGLIILSEEGMLEHFESNRNVAYLVFHEMLRSAGVNDDNYVISMALKNLPPEFRRKTSVVKLQPLVEEDSLSSSVGFGRFVMQGDSCSQLTETFVDVTENNSIKIVPRNFSVSTFKTYSSCTIAIPFALKAKTRLVLTGIDVEGTMDLEAGAGLTVMSEAMVEGEKERVRERVYNATNAAKQGRFLVREPKRIKSQCGKPGVLKMKIAAVFKYRGSAEVNSMIGNIAIEPCD